MAWTKRDIVHQAYTEIGVADYEFDLQPEMLQSGLRQLDLLLAGWATAGIRIGFSGGNGKGDIDAETAVPEWALRALYLNLAMDMAAGFGKQPSPRTMAQAKESYDMLLARTVIPLPRRLIGYAGSGTWWGNLPVAQEPLTAETGTTQIYGRDN
ncbi:MAG: packaged DNA stabilization gp4 family protein [Cypionkella sp.]|nr:packaged DNA stabilization gp4 family protein [Cypionkella sp.]